MALSYLKNWKYSTAKSSYHLKMKGAKLDIFDIGIFTDEVDDRQMQDLIHTILQENKKASIQHLTYVNTTSKEEVEYKYYKNNIKWYNVPVSQSIDEFLKYQYREFYIFLNELDIQKEFILTNIHANFVKATFTKDIERFATFTLETGDKNLVSKYKEINQTFQKLQKKYNDQS